MRTHEEYKALVDKRLRELLPEAEDEFESGRMPRLLSSSMRYSLTAGGKRLRPCMLLAACEMLGGDVCQALDFACAIEMIHTYSLIHDDLPGMDNDTLRRGRPTNHVVYGEGQAILAGDGLLNYAFEVMLARTVSNQKTALRNVKAMCAIASGAGVTGMIAGQVADLYAENIGTQDEKLLSYIHEGKTMAMFKGAVTAGAILADAEENSINALARFSEAFGILFQVTDDILDVTAEADKFGKTKGKDAEEGKLTAVSVYTLDGAKKRSTALKEQALSALGAFGAEADYFRNLTTDMFERTH